jgi:hypothetical protein
VSCEDLICAQCAGPVVEARCPACQAARAQVHHHSHLSKPLILAILLVLLLVALSLQQLAH